MQFHLTAARGSEGRGDLPELAQPESGRMGTRTRLCLAPDLLRLTAMSHHSSCWRNASPRYFTQIRWRSTLRPKPALQRWKGAGQFLPPPGHLGWRPPRMVSLENLIPPHPPAPAPSPPPMVLCGYRSARRLASTGGLALVVRVKLKPKSPPPALFLFSPLPSLTPRSGPQAPLSFSTI